MSKRQKPKDRQLDVPAEANRDKHVNFLASQRSETDPSGERSKESLDKGSKEDKGTRPGKIERDDINSER
jgi:hypothetical protein